MELSFILTIVSTVVKLIRDIFEIGKMVFGFLKKVGSILASKIKAFIKKLISFFKRKPPKEEISPLEKYIDDINKVLKHVSHTPGPSPYISLIYDNLLKIRTHLSNSLLKYDPFLEDRFRRYMEKAIYFSDKADLRYTSKDLRKISESVMKYLKKK